LFDDLKKPNLFLEHLLHEEPEDEAAMAFEKAQNKRKNMFKKNQDPNPIDSFFTLRDKKIKSEIDRKLILMYQKCNLNTSGEFERAKEKILDLLDDGDKEGIVTQQKTEPNQPNTGKEPI